MKSKIDCSLEVIIDNFILIEAPCKNLAAYDGSSNLLLK